MPLYEQEIVKFDLVLVGVRLLSEPQQVSAFSASAGGDVVPAGTGLVLSPDQRNPEQTTRLELPKDRIALELGPRRSAIERDYPIEDDLPRFADIVTLATENSSLDNDSASPKVHGYNLAMVYRQDSGESTYRYLGQRLFGRDAFAAPGWNSMGGIGKLTYEAPSGRWEFVVEPRFREFETDRVFLQLNLQKEQPTIPGKEEIVNAFGLICREAYALANRIDAGACT